MASERNDAAGYLGWFFLGGILGAAAALLIAPRTGRETRDLLLERSNEVAKRAQQAFSCGYFRVYSHTDVVGVELGGALKNVIALATGILEGLGLGHNPRAALITRGLAEMTRLGLAMGGDAMTFSGLAGIGDLIATCSSRQSRNNSVGLQLGQGGKIEDVLAAVGRGEMRPSDVARAMYPDYKEERATRPAEPSGESGWFGLRKAKSVVFKVPGEQDPAAAIPIRGVTGDLPVSFAPDGGAVPGDRIVGIMTPGEGITIYPIQSPALQQFEDAPERWLDVH